MKKEIITISILLLILLNIGCLSLKEAYIPQHLLTDGWYESLGSEEKGSDILGLNKWSTKVYKNGEVSYLSVTSLKSLIMQSKEELFKRIERDIKDQADRYGIYIIDGSRISGSREVASGHRTTFILYNGTKGYHNYRIIGEIWVCSRSGTSIICMGFSDLSDVYGIYGWRKIVADPEGSIEGISGNDGLIYNVVCH